MGILLNGDEIEALSEWWLGSSDEVDWAETLLRAQLGKLCGWIDGKGGFTFPDDMNELREGAGL